MRASTPLVLVTLSNLAFAGTGLAADQAAMQTLLKQGYEIRSTSFVPLAEIKRQRPKADEGVVLVTLQKQTSIAVCEINWANWSALAKASLANEKLCDVR
jgi:hypothetical protein